jgi:hypothetical protein
MATARGVHYTAFAAEYEAITAQARRLVASWPAPLREQAEPLLPQLLPQLLGSSGGSTFAPIVALLPCWLADLLDGQSATGGPSPEEAQTLGLANLLGWWAWQIQDWLLDQDPVQADLLPLSVAWHAAAVRLLQQLWPGQAAFWDAYQALSLASAEAQCRAGRHRFQALADLDDDCLAQAALDLPPDELAGRSALLWLSSLGQLLQRGYSLDDPLALALQEMLRHYAIARQIGDDRSDWVEDLQRGRLNYVSARVVRRMADRGLVRCYAELDVEWLLGYFLQDDELFADIHQVALAVCRQATRSIAPYRPLYLQALLDELVERLEHSYQVAVTSRRKLRALLAPRTSIPFESGSSVHPRTRPEMGFGA